MHRVFALVVAVAFLSPARAQDVKRNIPYADPAETRWRVHGLPRAKFGHREKFGNDPAKHRDFSAVTHLARDKGIPPFLILYVAGHPDTTAQVLRLGNVLKDAGAPATLFGARETTHDKLNADLGLPDDPATKALFEFLGKALKK
jgi:hypothetical protein